MASATANRTVNITGRGLLKEGTAAGTLTVGAHVTYAAGEIGLAGAGDVTKMIVAEAPERGKGVFSSGTTINTYVAGDQVPYYTFAAGDEALILLATSQTITEGELLEAGANGTFITNASGTPLFIAREAVTTTGATALLWAQAL